MEAKGHYVLLGTVKESTSSESTWVSISGPSYTVSVIAIAHYYLFSFLEIFIDAEALL
jgi:hypothetical protein